MEQIFQILTMQHKEVILYFYLSHLQEAELEDQSAANHLVDLEYLPL